MMELSAAIKYGTEQLATISDSARLDSELLLQKVLDCSKTFIYARPDFLITAEQLDYYKYLLQRRHEHVPIAYVTGEREFWAYNFKISNTTLIPRPATESLIEAILQLNLPDDTKACDLGTGSGAIAISLGKTNPAWDIIATDIQATALAVAAHNALLNAAHNIKFIWSNWFRRLSGYKFNLIVSNPPYIHPNDPHLMQEDVCHEPRICLESKDGSFDLRHIMQHAKKFLYTDGVLMLEHGYDQQSEVVYWLKFYGYKNILPGLDYAGVPRFCLAVCP